MISKDSKRQKRVRSKAKKVNRGRPRLTVFRSAKNIYAQVIDDNKRATLASASSVEKNIEKKFLDFIRNKKMKSVNTNNQSNKLPS